MPTQKDKHQDTILVIDDDKGLLRLIEMTLQTRGFIVNTATDGEAGMELFQQRPPALIILDVMMPGMDGLAVCRKIREQSYVPIIFLSARGHVQARIEGLMSGADDYMLKPFSVQELLVRIEALLWRARQPRETDSTIRRFGSGWLVINLQTRQVFVNGEMVHLSQKEFNLLEYLTSSPGRVYQIDQIFENVWSYESDADPKTVRWYIWRLRQKLETDPDNPRFILTEPGQGYKFSRI